MKRLLHSVLAAAALIATGPSLAQAELLAMVNYESKPETAVRKEGIAIMDIDPASSGFGQILADMPLPPDLVAHHIFYNKDMTKAYVTALGRSELRILDMTRYPYRTRVVALPGCEVGEDIAFSEKNKKWFMTCMGSTNVIVGDAATDQPITTLALPKPYPHGIAVHDGIDRILVTSTVNPADLKDAGEHITVIEASTGKVLSTHKVSNKPSPSGAAPVESFFAPNATPPIAYITNMLEGTLWTATWQPEQKTFDFRPIEDFAPKGQAVPLEVYFNKKGDRAFISTANPGHLNIYDIADPARPRHLKAIPAAGGAHHMAFSPDERYVFVQNSLIQLPGMNDGSISVIDLHKGEKVGSIDTLKNMGLNPNCIVLLPEFGGGHSH